MTSREAAPELYEAFRIAADRPLVIKQPNSKKAHSARLRLYQLRKAMQEANPQHPYYRFARKVEILQRELPDGTAELVLQPSDDELAAALRDAGVDIEEAPDIPTQDPTFELPDQTSTIIHKYLKGESK